MRREFQQEQQEQEAPSLHLPRILTLAVACTVWMVFFLWYWGRIPALEDFLRQNATRHEVFEFLWSTYPWGGGLFIVLMLVFLLTENVRKQTSLYKIGVNLFLGLFGIGLFAYVQALFPANLQGLT
ncbi:hypothetical protein [Deinococcus misasensis]|uniref:hypothetical protein n=1 Tax=Deinococcus misasensis TaxID=392413 RepID=UPI0005510A77|nr:hypothetical protein [Deinococcus misasensis]